MIVCSNDTVTMYRYRDVQDYDIKRLTVTAHQVVIHITKLKKVSLMGTGEDGPNGVQTTHNPVIPVM